MSAQQYVKACPFCGAAMMFRKALWPSDGCTDAIIHAAPTDCGLTAFDTETTDESAIAAWNRRASEAELVAALRAAEGHLEEMRKDATWHPIGDCPVLNNIRAILAKHGD